MLIDKGIIRKLLCTCILFSVTNCLAKTPDHVVVAYVTSWSNIKPDAKVMTHINYAFGHVNDSFDGIRIDNPDRLRQIVQLKKDNTQLKVLLSVGGWGSGRFSEMAADEKLRTSFAADCKRVIDEFGLDGIDIDWEYPGSSSANISSSPDDRNNFTFLIRDIRRTIGTKSVLSIASPAWTDFYDFKSFIDNIDFVNVMAYDMVQTPIHHASLHASDIAGKGMTCEKAVKAHLDAGVPTNKIVLGLPFYGHGTKETGNFCDYKDIIIPKGYTEHWDAKACVPYLTNDRGDIVICFDNARSLKLKCRYIKKNELRGAMYWDYAGDDERGTLRNAVWKSIVR